ncbi:MAG: efflux RND transporter periplasmic adaptor subunit [Candidatus Aminicenantes bacterium]|nr:efflux RND transporter periplasmic adaptor subunit [Candidatus Aminicenantes bacterium]
MKKVRFSLTVLTLIMLLAACQKKQDATPAAAVAGEGAAVEATESGSLLVEVKTVMPERFEHFFMVNGALEAVQDAFISAESNGQIKVIHVHEGQRVQKGELLVSLNSDITRNALAEVQNSLDLARTVFQKRQELWNRHIGSEIQYLEAKTNQAALENRLKSLQAQLDLAEIRAPFAGIIDKIFKKAGELAVPGLQLMQLVNLKRMRVNAEVAETYLGRIAPGDRIEITFPTYPGWRIQAPIARIGQVVSAKNRTVLVQAVLENAHEKLKPNMMATLRCRDFMAPASLVVPAIVIKNDLSGKYLYIVKQEKGKSVASKTYVTTGLTEGNRTMIIDGLAEGDRVIINGYSLAKNNMPVTIKP